ncbi:MAG: hypothetical protein ABI920_18560 [Casimicrobiaceae bacterium]
MKRFRIWIAAACGGMLWSGAAAAQMDCDKLVPDMQAKCEMVQRKNEVCAGKTGSERDRCTREVIVVPVTEDCRRVPAAARAMCEAHNRMAEKAERCNGLRGAQLTACKQANAMTTPLWR